MPLSVNELYSFSPKTRRVFLRPAGVAYKKKNAWSIAEQMRKQVCRMFERPVTIYIDMYIKDRRKHDIDNINKLLLDTLVYAGALEDDDLIFQLIVRKVFGDDIKGVKVIIEHYADYSGLIDEENLYRLAQIGWRYKHSDTINNQDLVNV